MKFVRILFVFINFLLVGKILPQEIINIKGSDTMLMLVQKWAEQYMQVDHSVSIQVSGGGSGIGIDALVDGTADICNASRPMKTDERNQLKGRYHSLGVETEVAKDGLSFFLNNSNPVNELTLEQIKKIYKGEITNWKEVGGTDARIILYGREYSSGTYSYVKDYILDFSEYAHSMQNLPSNVAIVNAVQKEPNAIGYGGAAFARGVKCAAVKETAESRAFKPTTESIRNNEYPVTRYLYMYTKTRPANGLKNFINWILSVEGQRIIKEMGYFELN